jgi:hypothetical protein
MVMTNRFDLEQQILDCWRVTEDITLLAKQNASTDSLNALSTYYEHKFNQLWSTFETMCAERQFNESSTEKS